MSLYAAIDLHSSNSVLAVIDGDGKPVLRYRRPNDLPHPLSELAPYRDELVDAAVEPTCNWYWLVDGLIDHGYAVHLVNTTAIPQYNGLKHDDDSVGDYASYCCTVESVRMSNGKRKGHGNRKCGNRYLCWAFMEAANHAVCCDPLIRWWYERERKRARKHRVVAIKAVAHKLARACYHMLHECTTFDIARATLTIAGRNGGLDSSQSL